MAASVVSGGSVLFLDPAGALSRLFSQKPLRALALAVIRS
jgi:hypothetical protein